MRLICLAALLVACFVAAGCSTCPMGHSPDEAEVAAEIEEAMHQSAADWTDDDLDGFMRAFHNSPETRFVTPGGITVGWDAIYERYRPSIANSNLWFTDIDVAVINHDTALCVARFHNVMHADDSYSTGMTSLLMRKIDGSWVIVHDHSSGLPLADYPRPTSDG